RCGQAVRYEDALAEPAVDVAALERVRVGGVGRQHGVAQGELTAGAERRAVAGRGELLLAGADRQRGQQEQDEPPHASCSRANASGSSSAIVQRRLAPVPTASTTRSAPNSASTWRQAPHGAA